MLKTINKKLLLLFLSFVMVLSVAAGAAQFASAASGNSEVTLPTASSVLKVDSTYYEASWTNEGLLWKTIAGQEKAGGVWTAFKSAFDLNQGPFSIEFTHNVWDAELNRIGNGVMMYLNVYDSQGYNVALLFDGYQGTWTKPMQNEITVTIYPNVRQNKDWGNMMPYIYPVTKADGDFVEGGQDLIFSFDKEEGFVSTYQNQKYVIDDVDGTFKELRENVGFAKDGIITVDLIVTSIINDTTGYDVLIKKLNGQSLACSSETTIVDTVAPAIALGEMPSACAVNEAVSAESAKASDIIDTDVALTMEVKKDGTTVQAASKTFTYTPTETGIYEFIFTATDDAGHVTTKTHSVMVKDNFTFPEITVDGTYQSTINCDEKLTILPFTAIDGDETLTNKIELVKGGEVLQEVSVGDEITLPIGVITIRYTSQDAANPEPNVTVKEFEVICIDTVAPVVTVEGVPTEATEGDIVTLPAGTATDNSGSVNFTITVTSPTKVKVTLDMNSFVAEEVGVYKVVYKAQDSLGNVDEETFEITVAEKKKGGCGSNIASEVCIVFSVVLLGAAVVLALRKKES